MNDDGLIATDKKHPLTNTRLLLVLICAGVFFAGLLVLGGWQLYRLQWKTALIERVTQRVKAPVVAAPGRDQWSMVHSDADAYRHVSVTGQFLHASSALVQATTERGSGFWLLTPLRRSDGSIVIINRGFVPTAKNLEIADNTRAETNTVVTGLLRMSEPHGGFLRTNDPSGNRWYSRDIPAIARARGLSDVAPYFIDAEASSPSSQQSAVTDSSVQPVAGLTVISFHNHHLVYALTWFFLALMMAAGVFWLWREESGLRQRHTE